ncbi:MAG: penicillin-binding protein 2 [Actinomycetes bacterium]
MDTDSDRIRLTAVGIVALSLFVALFVRLWFLQAIDRQRFEVASASNRLRQIHVEGPRGRILDRNGKILVDNRTEVVVAIDREPLRKLSPGRRDAIFADLAETLTAQGVPTKVRDIEKKYNDQRYAPQERVPLLEDVDERMEIFLLERGHRFPGLVVERRAVRVYPYGALAAHVVGYVGEINEKELAARGGEVPGATSSTSSTVPTGVALTKPYFVRDTIGKAGVERSFEQWLRGTPGERTVEVNAKGDLISVVSEKPAKAGDDVWLAIDIDLQNTAEQLLEAKVRSLRGNIDKDGKPLRAPQGSVVIEDPRNGQILAMASYPDYDPSLTVNGISTTLWEQLNNPDNGRPLFDWALQGTYAPGSTFKLFSAYAGMRTGFLNPQNERYYDKGSYKVKGCNAGKCSFRNAGGVRHGMVDVPRSLTVSSDVYYYWIGDALWQAKGQLGETALQDGARPFGIGQRTGIDLPGEAPGRLPTPRSRRELYAANPKAFLTDRWYTGDNILTSIGQGDVLVTPLQLANAYATFANGGTHFRPQIATAVTRPKDPGVDPAALDNVQLVHRFESEELGKVPFTPEQYQKILNGLIGVTQSAYGTAVRSWRASPPAWPMAGKTGTAQVVGKADTSVFAGFGPVSGGPPRYSISVIIPEAGFGGDVAAPLAFRIMKPVSENKLVPACTVDQLRRCEASLQQQLALVSGDVGSGGPG